MEQSGMEGWLYLIRSNRIGLPYFKKRYFVLEENRLHCFRDAPASINENPIRSQIIDPRIRVADNGRETIKKNVLYIFTVYNPSNQDEQLKLGTKSSEATARWIRCLMEAAHKEYPSRVKNVVACSKRRQKSFRLSPLNGRSRLRLSSRNCTSFSCVPMDPVAHDVIAPSPWTIFGCKNGLRLFKETKEDSQGKHWDDHPAIMAVGLVDATSESIFREVMSLGASRSEWDFCFSDGYVVQHIDGHTDIIHKKLKREWLPWAMRPRDLLLQRYWRREDDCTYVILYHSVFLESCRPAEGYVRACLKSGGYVISPVHDGRQSVVKHMLAIDWKSWKSYFLYSSAKEITIKMLGRIAALSELFRAKNETYPGFDFSYAKLARRMRPLSSEGYKVEAQLSSEHEESENCIEQTRRSSYELASPDRSFLQINDVADEFFDTMDESESELSENNTLSSGCSIQPQDQHYTKPSPTSAIVKRLHDLAAPNNGYVDLQEVSTAEAIPCSFGTTLMCDHSCTTACSWSTSDPSTFLIRSKTYLQDHVKAKANRTLMQMVGADWLKSDKREDDLGGRPGSIVQNYAAQGSSAFFFIVNIQVPGSTTYSLALYYMMNAPVQSVPLLHDFIKGDDAFRNSRFKLIPYISKGSWIVKQSVGKKACLIGQALEMNYFHGKNYLELGVDIGSSSVARGVVSLVLGYLTNLVIEMAFLIQGNTSEELPEFLLGTCRLNHLDASCSTPISPLL